MAISQKNIQLICEDGIQLSGTLLQPENPKACILFNSATAVPKAFYLPMAKFFASHNYSCLIYDYRGVCSSQPKNGLKACEFNLIDWGKQDMVAGISFLKETYPKLPLFLICHSVGGQLVGLAPNINQAKGMLAIATSSGYWKNMPLKYRIQTQFFFEVVRPITHLLFGYSKLKFLGIMEDLPKNVSNKWRKWCSKNDYLFDPANFQEIKALSLFKKLEFPIHVFSATDDNIASWKNVNALWKHFQSSKGITHQQLKPIDFNLKSIGHFKFFSKKSESIFCPLALQKIEEFDDHNSTNQ